MLLDPRNGPAYDLPPPAAAPRTYIVATTPRTGSTLLCRGLWPSGCAGAPKEYLNPMQIRDWEVRLGSPTAQRWHRLLRGPLTGLAGRGWRRRRLVAHLERVRARRSGRWFGLKLHHHHLVQWFGADPDPCEVEALLGPIRWIHLVRADRAAQAVSWYRALQTGAWVSEQRALLPPLYSQWGIGACLEAIERAEAGWAAFFLRAEAPLQLEYEAIADDPSAVIRRVRRWLDLPEDTTTLPALRRQADEVNAAWIAQYLSG